jgi:hypothetical protein
MRNIRVTGVGKLSRTPNWVVINFIVVGEDINYQEAINKVNKRTVALRSVIVESGFKKEDLKTVNFTVNARYSYKDGQNIFVGYEARHDLKLEFDFNMDTLNKLLANLANSRSEALLSISFEVKEKEEFNNALIIAAIKDAFNKAKLISETSNVKLGRIINIVYGISQVAYRSPFKYESSQFAVPPSSMDFTPGDIEGTTFIEIEWELVNNENIN